VGVPGAAQLVRPLDWSPCAVQKGDLQGWASLSFDLSLGVCRGCSGLRTREDERKGEPLDAGGPPALGGARAHALHRHAGADSIVWSRLYSQEVYASPEDKFTVRHPSQRSPWYATTRTEAPVTPSS